MKKQKETDVWIFILDNYADIKMHTKYFGKKNRDYDNFLKYEY